MDEMNITVGYILYVACDYFETDVGHDDNQVAQYTSNREVYVTFTPWSTSSSQNRVGWRLHSTKTCYLGTNMVPWSWA